MDIPNYVPNTKSESAAQENYNQQLNATLLQNLGQLGFNITSITIADLTTTSILDPNTGNLTTVQDLALVGATWFVADNVPPVAVQKVSANPTVLKQFTATAWP